MNQIIGLMKNIIFLFLLVTNFLSAQIMWQIKKDTVVKWSYYDGDEFNHLTVNHNKWNTSFPWSRSVLSQDIYYLESNIKLQNGNVQFVLEKKDTLFGLHAWEIDTNFLKKKNIKLIDGNKFPYKYTGGLIYSKKDYKYGYFEIKFRAPVGQGIWPAFWMYAGKPNNEIDFFELKGEKENELHVDIHCPSGCSNYKEGVMGYRRPWGHWQKTTNKLKDGFNIIAGEWTKDYLKWYLNGELIAYSDHSFDLAMGLTAGTGIAKDGEAFKPGPNSKTPFPNYFNVDYIRVYKSDTLPNYNEIKNNLIPAIVPNIDSLNDFKVSKARKKLKNNKNKKIKNAYVLTLSLMQINENSLVLRVLGLCKNQKIHVKFLNDNQIFQELIVNSNSEVVIPTYNYRIVKFEAKVGDKIITENIKIQ